MQLAARLLGDLLVCLRFCSRLPLPTVVFEQSPYGFGGFAQAIRMLPLAGGSIGGLAALVLATALALGFPPRIASALAIGAAMLMTGALHEDGLADCADGFGGGTSRERKLEIMRDSRIGTYGALAIALTLYLRVESVASLVTRSLPLAITTMIAAAALSRTAAIVPSSIVPPARADGSGHAAGRPDPRSLAVAIAIAVVIALAPLTAGADPRAALVSLAAVAGLSVGVTGLAHRQIGGHTGDVAGSVQQLSELTVLLAYTIH